MPATELPPVSVEDFRDTLLRHLKLSLGKDPEHASRFDWRMALSFTLRDHVVDPWFESTRKTYEARGKRVYYLSMEFLIGRLIEDVAVNLRLDDIAEQEMVAFFAEIDVKLDHALLSMTGTFIPLSVDLLGLTY